MNELAPLGELREGRMRDLLGYRLAQAAVLTTEVFVRVVGKPLDLRPVEFTILQLIDENPAATATKIAKALAITTPGVTLWLDRLEERGLIARERSGTDRRAQHLTCTQEGKALVGSALEQLLEGERELLLPLSVGERHLLSELLQKITSVERAGASRSSTGLARPDERSAHLA
jgi:DNA-binding MarR family transcriptional regulator